jgi:hypothetical protein
MEARGYGYLYFLLPSLLQAAVYDPLNKFVPWYSKRGFILFAGIKPLLLQQGSWWQGGIAALEWRYIKTHIR